MRRAQKIEQLSCFALWHASEAYEEFIASGRTKKKTNPKMKVGHVAQQFVDSSMAPSIAPLTHRHGKEQPLPRIRRKRQGYGCAFTHFPGTNQMVGRKRQTGGPLIIP